MASPQPISAKSQARIPDAPPDDAEILLTGIQLRQLGELREIGMDLARELSGQVGRAEGKGPPLTRIISAYNGLTKSIRQIMALEQHTLAVHEKRIAAVRQNWLLSKRDAVKTTVERSLDAAKPGLGREGRERLLSDLFSDYRDYGRGSIRDIVANICKKLGIAADLSLWDEPPPTPEDIALSSGFDWVVPANGGKPYTTVMSPAGINVRQPFDSPHLVGRHGSDPPSRN